MDRMKTIPFLQEEPGGFKQVSVRLPWRLKDRLDAVVARSRESQNGIVILALESYIGGREDGPEIPLTEQGRRVKEDSDA